jgi:two-component system, chemotaxis family, response regulator Rcp1
LPVEQLQLIDLVTFSFECSSVLSVSPSWQQACSHAFVSKGGRVRILLVEDNAGDVFLVRRALEKRGLRPDFTVARDGEEAIRLLDQAAERSAPDQPELVLLDLNLPKINGVQILYHLRHTPAFADTPVIVITSSDSPADRERAMALGANIYFRKPTDLDSFMQFGRVVEDLITAR